MRNEQRAYKPAVPPPPLDFAQGRLVYTENEYAAVTVGAGSCPLCSLLLYSSD